MGIGFLGGVGAQWGISLGHPVATSFGFSLSFHGRIGDAMRHPPLRP